MQREQSGPMVTIVIPVYNGESFIHECVSSALDQTYARTEVLVVDDGSSDSTPDILKTFGDRIRVVRKRNGGTASALNQGIEEAQGDLIAWLSADDLFVPEKIRLQVERFQIEPELCLVYSDWVGIDSSGDEKRVVRSLCPDAQGFAAELLRGNFINGSSVVVRRKCVEEAGLFDETLATDSDGDMWFKLLKRGCRFGHVAEPLTKYRTHSGSLSRKHGLHRLCKDRVRERAIRSFTSAELFGEDTSDDDISAAYESLAIHFGRQLLFAAARASLDRVPPERRTAKGNVLRVLFRLLNSRTLLALLLGFRELRRQLRSRCQGGG